MALTKLTATNLGANAVTANSIGYTPANKAGDTFTGQVRIVKAGNNTTTLTPTTAKDFSTKISADGVTNTQGYIFDGIAMGGAGEEYSGIYSYDDGSSAGTGVVMFGGTASAIAKGVDVDSLGRVRMPNKPFVNGYPNGAAITSPAKTVLTSSTIQNATFSNSRFTCTVAGLYECVLNTAVQTGYNENDIWVYKNGAQLNPIMGSWASVNSDWVNLHMQVVIPCAANDYLEFYWRGNMYGNASWNYFHFMHVG